MAVEAGTVGQQEKTVMASWQQPACSGVMGGRDLGSEVRTRMAKALQQRLRGWGLGTGP
jgi:hypothetical protein